MVIENSHERVAGTASTSGRFQRTLPTYLVEVKDSDCEASFNPEISQSVLLVREVPD